MNYDTLKTKETVDKTAEALRSKGYEVSVLGTAADALQKIKELVPAGASLMNGSSRTLEQIGFVEYLKSGTHGWDNLHEGVLAEKDPVKQGVLRKQATLSEYYLGSVHAMTETGEFIIASNTGSQLPHIVYTSSHLVLVVSTKKIVPALSDAFRRLEDHVIPLEDENMKQKYGIGTMLSKMVVFKQENKAITGRTVHILLVNEDLGF